MGTFEILIGCGYLFGVFTIAYVSLDMCRRKFLIRRYPLSLKDKSNLAPSHDLEAP